jgi:hypothetical protein
MELSFSGVFSPLQSSPLHFAIIRACPLAVLWAQAHCGDDQSFYFLTVTTLDEFPKRHTGRNIDLILYLYYIVVVVKN